MLGDNNWLEKYVVSDLTWSLRKRYSIRQIKEKKSAHLGGLDSDLLLMSANQFNLKNLDCDAWIFANL